MKKYWLLLLAIVIAFVNTSVIYYLYTNNDVKWDMNKIFAVVLAGSFFYAMAIVCVDLYYLELKINKREK